MAVYDEWEAANAKVAGLSLDALTHTELLELQHRREVVVRSLPAVDHQIINRLAAEADPKALGGTSLADVLATKLRISKQEARRRIKQAELSGAAPSHNRRTVDAHAGEHRRRAGARPDRSGACAHHREVLRRSAQPHRQSDPRSGRGRPGQDRQGLGPTQFRAAADRLALLLNQDGEPPHDAERARRRYLTIEKQGVDGMSRIHGLLDPECPRHRGGGAGQMGRPGHVQSR